MRAVVFLFSVFCPVSFASSSASPLLAWQPSLTSVREPPRWREGGRRPERPRRREFEGDRFERRRHDNRGHQRPSLHSRFESTKRRDGSRSLLHRDRDRRPRGLDEGRNFKPSDLQPGRDVPADECLEFLDDDPRVVNGVKVAAGNSKGKGRNTESFVPESTLVRPEMRVLVGPKKQEYGKLLKHDDVVIVPELVCDEDDWSLYYKLIEEIRHLQQSKEKNADWIPWHEGCHLISKAPEKSQTFQEVMGKITKYFNMKEGSQGIRFNWYRDASDWKPFHHDSAAFNRDRARKQNITVGVSFGATRELAFLHADTGLRTYFPQSNGMVFSFGRDVNIKWKHGINALPADEQHGKGRISIIVWGQAQDTVEEPDSPPMIDNGRGGGGRRRH
uniref:Fe2OG dioxygenase domain-containing protein n=1 Tax=Chromera velia CCMP2878 TaxID=1169474 RepID=A0A0G4GW06_9ALVE|eukprot:Cvel_23600.t1-p1 / transcript=Cvel_23600.t1 / gene=Cvel_23600 / organism=Chromera_velia_CCMP2878 / gene_product=hypothetical protein / transcript_product=hypothetical protein / location=Cvel_scaffold2450:18847-20010(-) / protein_length=388 / sequence_SO=supercontig / SO=protein_coding / is_pseudo=false